MTPEQFCYWLRGALELCPEVKTKGLDPEQVRVLEEHLNLVITAVRREPTPATLKLNPSTGRIC